MATERQKIYDAITASGGGSPDGFVDIVLKATERYHRAESLRRVEDLIMSDNWLVFHDVTCAKVTGENALEWDCDCFLSEILDAINGKETNATTAF
jgi:hypothetical protein